MDFYQLKTIVNFSQKKKKKKKKDNSELTEEELVCNQMEAGVILKVENEHHDDI